MKLFLVLLILIASKLALAQEVVELARKPLIFTKAIPLNWQSVKLNSINYSEIPVDGGGSIYTLADKASLKFHIKLVLPVSLYALNPSLQNAYNALNDMWILGGFDDLTFEQIQKILFSNGIFLSTAINKSGQITISIEALTKKFSLALNLLRKLLFKPQFSESALNIWKQENIDSFYDLMNADTYAKQMNFVDNRANILSFGKEHIFANSLKDMSPAIITKIKIQDIKNIYKSIFSKTGLNLWLVGNYNLRNISQIKKLIADMPNLDPSVYSWLPGRDLRNTSIVENKTIAAIIKKNDMEQCNISLRYYFPELGKLNALEETDYLILQEIFSSKGGIIGNDRFSNAMRAQSGLSYAPYAYFKQNIVYPNTNLAAVYLNFQASNDRLVDAINLARKTWEVFLEQGISQVELDNARNIMINRLLATELTSFNKIEAVIDQITKLQVSNKNPLALRLKQLSQLTESKRLNATLAKLAKAKFSSVLAIMGNPEDKQITLLKEYSSIALQDIIDFNDLTASLQ